MAYFFVPSLELGVDKARRAVTVREDTKRPAPVAVPASQEFDGNDGPWSSFTVQVGTPPQDVKVLISTASYQTLVVVPEGCTSSDPPNCVSSRGGEFVSSLSSTWRVNNITTNGTFTLDLEGNLGYSGNGDYGFDTVGMSWQGSGTPSLEQQIVGEIATKEFYLGIFGLNPKPTNFTNFNDPVPSYMATLKERNIIPSISWGYTDGNQYRLDTVLGSLTLGGYDPSRFIQNNVTFSFNEIDTRELTVNINDISINTYHDDGSSTKSTRTIAALIDSTVPYIYLPLDVCEMFEDTLGIEWDNEVQAYLVNDTLHSALQAQNSTVTFSLEDPSTAQIVNISLPYPAFDLTASYPLVTNRSRYFPLMRATNESQYTLGRTFLQEAYVIADYERRSFSVSQCSWNAAAERTSVAITSPSALGGSPRLSHGQIIGMSVGSVTSAILMLLVAGIKFKRYVYSRKGVSREPKLHPHESVPPFGASREHELDGEEYFGMEIDGIRLPGHEIGGCDEHELSDNGWIYELYGDDSHNWVLTGQACEGNQ